MRSARLLVPVAILVVATLTGCIRLPLPTLGGDEPVGAPPAVVGECPWADAAPSPSVTPQDLDPVDLDPVARTEAMALSEDRFWPLIEAIPDAPAPEDFRALSSQLAGCAFDDLIAFDARLTLTLYALDGPDNLDWYEKHDPIGFGFASDDVFLYARCASVLGGRDSWAHAVDQGTLDWGADAPDESGSSEALLYVAADAAGAQGVDIADYYDAAYGRIPISYETGSNTDLWGD